MSEEKKKFGGLFGGGKKKKGGCCDFEIVEDTADNACCAEGCAPGCCAPETSADEKPQE